jgi:formylmethanofuran dehydrogenase subunit B
MPESDFYPPQTAEDRGQGGLAVIEPVTCLACGCLCDDISVDRDGQRIIAARNACEHGREWLRRERLVPSNPLPARIDGQPASADEAVKRAAELLVEARAPVILGLSHSTNETVAAALELADLIGAAVEPGDGRLSTPRVLAFQRSGRVSATLGEVKTRADVVVFWGTDPVKTHPRHWERYSVMPRGRFVTEGRASRTVIVVDHDCTATAEQADVFVKIDEVDEFETLWTLRALIRGISFDTDRAFAGRGAGAGLDDLRKLASQLQAAHYGAFFHGPVATRRTATESAAILEAMNGLVRDLNRETRFVIIGMGEPGNTAGAEAVLTWQTGFPTSVNLGPGHPTSLSGVTSAADRLGRREADMALIVGEFANQELDSSAQEYLARIPTVVIGGPEPIENRSTKLDVWLSAAIPGLEEEGTVMRVDGVSLPLRQIRKSLFPHERNWIKEISRLLRTRETNTVLTVFPADN